MVATPNAYWHHEFIVMADSTTNLDLIQGSQLQKEVTANELFDAMSPAAMAGRRASKCSGLTWTMVPGRYRDFTTVGQPYQLTPSTTTYVVMSRDLGVVTYATDTTNWDNDAEYSRLYKIVTDTLSVTSYEDHRNMQARIL